MMKWERKLVMEVMEETRSIMLDSSEGQRFQGCNNCE